MTGSAPLVERLEPAGDPAELAATLLDLPYPIFLDSATGLAAGEPHHLGRYSFLSADPVLVVRSKGPVTEVLEDGLRATVVDAIRLADRIVEVIVRAPLAAQRFRPGQFYRLQNYEGPAEVVDGIRLTMEGLALTGAWTDPARGLISLIVLEMGGSSRLCALLEPGEDVVLMGPTGTP